MSQFVIPSAVSAAINETANLANNATDTAAQSKYRIIADFVAELFAGGNLTGVHLTLVSAQDACKVGPAWNIWNRGIRNALKHHGLILAETRNYRSGKGAFMLKTEAAVKVEAEAAEAAAQALADKAEAEAAEAAKAADRATTARDIAVSVMAEADRLAIDPRAVLAELAELIAEAEAAEYAARHPELAEAA